MNFVFQDMALRSTLPTEATTPTGTFSQDTMPDYMYHLGVCSTDHEVQLMSDVKVVCMQGSAKRTHEFANAILDYLDIELPLGAGLEPLFKTERYELYKVGPVLCVSHGMGMPSISILLHEITKLLQYAGAKDVLYMRIGTSGGLGLAPGTVVIGTEALTSEMTPVLKRMVLGKPVFRPCLFDMKMVGFAADAITKAPEQRDRPIRVTTGKTMGLNDFFEEQGRRDGAIVEHTEQDKMEWFHRLQGLGVKNLEMEGPEFAAFTHHLHIPAILMCVTLLDRMQGDQINVPPEVLASYSDNLWEAALRVVKQAVNQGIPTMNTQLPSPVGA